jgi:hypothetical protein
MIKIFRRTTLLLAVSLLAGACATSPERQAQLDNERCSARGHQAGSKEHDDCVSTFVSQRDARQQAQHRELVERRVTIPGR